MDILYQTSKLKLQLATDDNNGLVKVFCSNDNCGLLLKAHDYIAKKCLSCDKCININTIKQGRAEGWLTVLAENQMTKNKFKGSTTHKLGEKLLNVFSKNKFNTVKNFAKYYFGLTDEKQNELILKLAKQSYIMDCKISVFNTFKGYTKVEIDFVNEQQSPFYSKHNNQNDNNNNSNSNS